MIGFGPLVTDSVGLPIDPNSMQHVYSYNSDNTFATDTCTNGVTTWVKTYGYTNGLMTSESAWVRQ